MHFSTILYPTDFSEFSRPALAYATDLAKDHQARLIVLHVAETLGPENITYAEATSQPQPAGYRHRLWDQIHEVLPQEELFPREYVLIEGDPASGIVRTAGEKQCDLIVMGSHGRSGIHRWLEGSVSEKVVRLAPCPVLVVKPWRQPKPIPIDKGTELHPHDLSETQG
jgi:nucleotide-binding universal stress UspA family protein